MELVIITGMSGAGKSLAANVLEDIGYYCIDNLPPSLLRPFVDLSLRGRAGLSKIAVVTDIRSKEMFSQITEELDELNKAGQGYKILFLDSSDECLARRYKETRRMHPLAGSGNSNVAALQKERKILEPIRARADYIVDTSFYSTSALKQRLASLFMGNPNDTMHIQCLSFGFKYGNVEEADLVLDVRFLPNPYYDLQLRPLTGLDKPIQDFVLSKPQSQGFLERLYGLLDYCVPLYREEGKSQLVIAIGCTGGKHRSVTLTEQVCAHLNGLGYSASVNHRDINKV